MAHRHFLRDKPLLIHSTCMLFPHFLYSHTFHLISSPPANRWNDKKYRKFSLFPSSCYFKSFCQNIHFPAKTFCRMTHSKSPHHSFAPNIIWHFLPYAYSIAVFDVHINQLNRASLTQHIYRPCSLKHSSLILFYMVQTTECRLQTHDFIRIKYSYHIFRHACLALLGSGVASDDERLSQT